MGEFKAYDWNEERERRIGQVFEFLLSKKSLK